jgi:ketosteroid isomerase-like protein
MSDEQNFQLVGRIFEALARRDFEDFVECFHPAVEFMLPRNILEGGGYRGLDGVGRAWADIWADWDDFRYEQEDIRAVDDTVVSLGLATNVGKDRGPSIEYQAAYVLKIQQAKVIKFQPYLSHQEALKAVGLAE